MFKVICFLKRKPGMSREEFKTYYESTHRLLGEKHVRWARHYARRYVEPILSSNLSGSEDFDYDAITEMWFDDRASFNEAMEYLAQPEINAEIAEDEENLFDRSRTQLVTVDECISPVRS